MGRGFDRGEDSEEEVKGNSWSYSPAAEDDGSGRILKETAMVVRVDLPILVLCLQPNSLKHATMYLCLAVYACGRQPHLARCTT
jgi:hypothetical protein